MSETCSDLKFTRAGPRYHYSGLYQVLGSTPRSLDNELSTIKLTSLVESETISVRLTRWTAENHEIYGNFGLPSCRSDVI